YTTAALNIYSSQIQVNSCRFDNSWERGIYLEGCSPDINNCSFTGNQTEGLYFIGLDANKEFIFSNNSFTDNVNWAVLGKLEDATVGITLSGNSSTGSSHNGFGMSGVIGGDITLDGDDGFPFIVNGSIMVSENSGLSISEGTVFKYNGIGHSLDIHGSLTSGGTELNPVVFTSIKDDSYGNDSNNDGNSSFPAYGDWAAIWMRETSTGDFKHTYFLYGGGEYTSAALNIYSSQVQVNSCRFDNSSERGIYLEGCSPDINNCSFTGNQYEGLYFRGLDASKVLEFSNNTFTDNVNWPVFGELKDETVGVTLSGNSSTGSSHNGFGMFGVIGGDNTLDGDDGFPFIVFNILTVSENAGLTISPGSIFKFVDYNSGIWVSGTLNAKGKKDQPIIFTSISDDCFGGDTENDSLNSVPNAYDWGTVGFNEGSSGNMDYCYIMYSGGEAAITIKSDDVVVKHCIISESGYRGISVIAANPKIESNSILMNEVGIQVLAEGNPVIENNRIVSNNKGIINNGAIFITATNNWWGSENGPKNEVYNPDGRGNAVEGNVDIYPWITNQPVGTISGNVPDFDFIIQGNSVEFQNKSENASSFHWNFNDDSESNSSNPYHEYENPGTYEVCLTAQFCDVYETVTKKIQIEGIHSITPLEGGNTGEVTFNVYGGGFTENTSIQLKNSSSVLLPDTTIIIDTDHLVVRFNMFEKPVGEYLIEIIEDGEFLYAATDTFKLQAGEFPEPWVDITSRKAFLSNIWHKLTITYGNTANVDA
ncbi:MAG: right-handed parallel beta-helix repeat-containing protein, partial [Mariniphaga sp.]|nr:right-handed parallel beta-helix repeat-containing protein [Mariniphaga sp.]